MNTKETPHVLIEISNLETEIRMMSHKLRFSEDKRATLLYELQGIHTKHDEALDIEKHKYEELKTSHDKLTAEKSRWLRKQKRSNHG